MKHKLLTLFTLLCTSCIKSDSIIELPTYTNDTHEISRVTNEDVKIINNAKNITLIINSCVIDNKTIFTQFPITVEYKDVVTLNDVDLNKVSIMKLDGKLISNNITIYEGLMYVPIKDSTIELCSGCAWYNQNGNKILHSIEFDADVNDWCK